MMEAINILYDVWANFLNWILNDAILMLSNESGGAISIGVSLGYIMIACIVISIMIRNVLAIPSKGQNYTFKGDNYGDR